MLRRYTWERARQKCLHYKRRRPEATTLYRVVYYARQELEYVWEQYFQTEYGALRHEVLIADEQFEKFVARYIERSPLSLEKLSLEDDIVTYTTNDGTAHEFDAVEFLALLTSHIPNRYESITRYYGYFSSRSRGERIKKVAANSEHRDSLPEVRPMPSSSWASCMKQVFEIDPLEYPSCKGQMRVIAFIQDPNETKKIMESLGLPQFRAPPPIPKPPRTQEELFIDYDA